MAVVARTVVASAMTDRRKQVTCISVLNDKAGTYLQSAMGKNRSAVPTASSSVGTAMPDSSH